MVEKVKQQKETHLKRIRPEIYESENAFLDIILTRCDNPIAAREYRETCLLPYMSVETLSKDRSRIPGLPHYRTNHMPEEWVTFDNNQILAAWVEGAIEQKFCSGCICMYGKSYG